jgi:hypothetical protein
MALSPADAAALYRSGLSACQIAQANKLTKAGAQAAIRKGGRSGLGWCPLCRKLEEV